MSGFKNNCIFLLTILSIATSCQYFDAEKKSSEAFYKEEAASINWKEVDRYPLLESCSELSEKSEQRQCFAREVSKVVQDLVDEQLTISGQRLKDTVYLQFFVSEKAEILITGVRMRPGLMEQLPELREVLLGCADSLKLLEPAFKRGIPVKTSFTLPVVLRSGDL